MATTTMSLAEPQAQPRSPTEIARRREETCLKHRREARRSRRIITLRYTVAIVLILVTLAEILAADIAAVGVGIAALPLE
jgi:hypothetical protein